MASSSADTEKRSALKRKYPLTLAARPRSYYVELAEVGTLMDFLQNFMSTDFHQDEVFRKEMLYILLDNSEHIVPEVEQELLIDLQASLAYFLEKVHECNDQTP